MKIELTKTELEDIESLKQYNGYKILVKIYEQKKNEKINQCRFAQDKEIVEKNITRIEKATEKIHEINGFINGMEFVLDLIDTAYQRRKKIKL